MFEDLKCVCNVSENVVTAMLQGIAINEMPGLPDAQTILNTIRSFKSDMEIPSIVSIRNYTVVYRRLTTGKYSGKQYYRFTLRYNYK